MILEICEAIDFGHKEFKIVHRDLKPQNILVDSFEKSNYYYYPQTVQVCDYGVARYKEANQTLSTMHGTLMYLPPEVFQWATGSRAKINHPRKIDVWAIACITYELFTGRKCFRSEPEICNL